MPRDFIGNARGVRGAEEEVGGGGDESVAVGAEGADVL